MSNIDDQATFFLINVKMWHKKHQLLISYFVIYDNNLNITIKTFLTQFCFRNALKLFTFDVLLRDFRPWSLNFPSESEKYDRLVKNKQFNLWKPKNLSAILNFLRSIKIIITNLHTSYQNWYKLDHSQSGYKFSNFQDFQT